MTEISAQWSTEAPQPRSRTAFTPEEFARLYVLREQCQTKQDCGEFGLDERRLRFARWLVAHGRLSEGVERA